MALTPSVQPNGHQLSVMDVLLSFCLHAATAPEGARSSPTAQGWSGGPHTELDHLFILQPLVLEKTSLYPRVTFTFTTTQGNL